MRLQVWYQTKIIKLLSQLPLGQLKMIFPDGVEQCFGKNPEEFSAMIHVKNSAFFRKIFWYGDIGFGESYMDGDWKTDNLSNVIGWFILNLPYWPSLSGTKNKKKLINWFGNINQWIHQCRRNTLSGSQKNIQEHYDLGNDFFKLFLDPTLTYSCAYFESQNQTLEMAQIAKYDQLCRKLKIKPQDHVLEIGTGWGGFCKHAAQKYHCKIKSITISKEQYLYASQQIQKEGLTPQVQIQYQDYRHLKGQFDKIVSIEMLEAVGHGFLKNYFSKCQELLKPQGLLGLQFITCPDQRHKEFKKGVDWIQKHIFPGSLLLSVNHVNTLIQKTGTLILHHLEEMGHHYEKTLTQWIKNFNAHLEEVEQLGMDERFIRKWNYYLAYCHAAFKMRNISVVQAIYTRPNNLSL
jgi:cyclopropane-fatty-acyl-phospholipid synthase